MILPIVAYGHPVLKAKAINIEKSYPNLKELIANMYDTMHNASGVGLAAPQIGLSIRLFITDGAAYSDDKSAAKFKEVFINPVIEHSDGAEWSFNEGCLSIPGIREDIDRQPEIRIRYRNENFEEQVKNFKGVPARIIQHEYDHIEGILFTDHLSILRRRLLKNKLLDISKGKVDVDYRMKFPLKK